jgi:hypothetical protein
MSDTKYSLSVLDGPDAFPDFGNPEWIARIKKEAESQDTGSEFSARSRKKKRIYKRKKSEQKPDA